MTSIQVDRPSVPAPIAWPSASTYTARVKRCSRRHVLMAAGMGAGFLLSRTIGLPGSRGTRPGNARRSFRPLEPPGAEPATRL